MNKALLSLAMLACSCALFALTKIAVLSPAIDQAIIDDVASPIVDKILEELLKSRKFSIVDRSSRDVIWEERNFQLSSGEIDRSEIKNIGQGLGADYVVVVKVKKIGSLYSMSTTMIDVETLEVIAQSSSEAAASAENLLQLAKYCGSKLAAGVSNRAKSPEGNEAADGGESGDTAGTDKSANGSKLGEEEYYSLKNDMRVMLQQKMFMKTEGQSLIAAKAGALSVADRYGLFQEYEKGPGMAILAMIINMIPFPIPFGSLIQGDIGGFICFGILESASIGAVIFLSTTDNYGLMTISSLVFTVSWICAWIQPYIYVGNSNKRLSRALNVVASSGPRDAVLRMAEAPGGGAEFEATLVSFSY